MNPKNIKNNRLIMTVISLKTLSMTILIFYGLKNMKRRKSLL